MSDHTVFIVKTVVGAGIICSLQKAVHFVLIQIDHTDIAVIVIIVDKICTGLAVCYFLLFHIERQISSIERVAMALRLSSAVIPARKL